MVEVRGLTKYYGDFRAIDEPSYRSVLRRLPDFLTEDKKETKQ